MAYVSPDFATKSALKKALAEGRPVEVYQPFLGDVPVNGTIQLEGPHYPRPHTWYCTGVMENGRLVKVK